MVAQNITPAHPPARKPAGVPMTRKDKWIIAIFILVVLFIIGSVSGHSSTSTTTPAPATSTVEACGDATNDFINGQYTLTGQYPDEVAINQFQEGYSTCPSYTGN